MKAVLRRKDRGQSIPLIALMIVLLFAMVGLSVDVGNTYAEQRTAARATNAAAIAGIDAVIKGYDDASIAQIIKKSLTVNGVHLIADGGNRTIRAYYMDVAGNTISNCEIGSCSKVPDNTTYVQVSTEGVVDTYFARVVGRATLPVNATAWAGRCTPTNGIYPLAISAEDINSNDFKAPTGLTQAQLAAVYGSYSDSDYSNKHWLRIYMKDNPPGGNGNFSMLNWQADQNWGTPELIQAFDGDGNLAEGFKEAKWPEKKPGEPIPGMPNGYPLKPGQLSAGDLIATTPGQKFATGIKSEIQTLMNEHTVLMLPIVDKTYGSGNNYVLQVSAIGKFYIVDPFPNDPNNGGLGEQGGNNSYIDMVYLGEANESACAVTNIDPIDSDGTSTTPTPPIDNPTVRIPFQVNPRWTGQDVPSDPIAYQLVVDVSGSMSWDFYGNGSKGGTPKVNADTTGSYSNVRCEWSAPANSYSYDDTCNGGFDSSWWNYKQRRIYVTKSAITDFINDLRANDVMRYTAFTSGSSYSGNTKVVPDSGFTGDKTLLLNELSTLGAYKNDPYRTYGGTPGPQALAAARDVLASAPTLANNGQKFRNVVIYLTDGVANVYLNGTTNYARDICGNLTRTQATNTPDPCQVGYSDTDKMNRPITEMINQANKIKTSDSTVQIYTIALAGVATDGLEKVASSASMLYKADDPNFVGTVLAAIRERTLDAKCLSLGGSGYIDRIPAANHTSLTGQYALASDEYGKVTLYNEAGTVVVATGSIKHDSFSGKLGVELNVPPGNYLMSAWIGYKGPDKPTAKDRVYTALSWNQVTFNDRIAISVLQDGSLNSVTTLPTVYVDLPATQNVCTS